MSDLRELYQEMIIDHGRHPRHYGTLPSANYRKEGHNPLCGDQLTVYVQTDNERIEKMSFEGCGCAISMASASLMMEAMTGKTFEEAERLFSAFHELVTEGQKNDALGKLVVLAGVLEFPARVKCATLAWHTLKAALKNDTICVTTE